MTMKRSLSTKENRKKKISKLDTENTEDYTKSLTFKNVDTIDIDDEDTELNNAIIPEQIKSAKKAQASKKKVLKENKLSKNTKAKPNTTKGIY